MKTIRIFDCFAGVGGFHVGAQLAFPDRTINVVARCEFDERARITYDAWLEGNFSLDIADIRTVTRGKLGSLRSVREIRKPLAGEASDLDLFTAGFPCQPHSLMGNRQGASDPRGEVAADMLAVIAATTPKVVVLENVRAIRSVNGGSYFKAILQQLEAAGYSVTWMELNAADFGVPQVRRRLFIVANRESKRPMPPVIQVARSDFPTAWHLLERSVSESYYLSDRIKKTILADQHKGYKRPADINRLIARPLTRSMHKMHRASQDNYYSDDFIHGVYDEAARRVELTRHGSARIRRITPREAFRIQGFPERMIDRALATGVSNTQLYMQAGNAVPPPLAAAVLRGALSD